MAQQTRWTRDLAQIRTRGSNYGFTIVGGSTVHDFEIKIYRKEEK